MPSAPEPRPGPLPRRAGGREAWRSLRTRAAILAELIAFLWNGRLWWMIPVVLAALLAVLLTMVGEMAPLAPLVYPLF